jgi:hypothetical protein
MGRSFSKIAIAAVVVLATVSARAQTIDPPGSIVDGKSIADWTVGWWSWVAQFPPPGQVPPANPLDNLDNGALATANNNGPVFYVAGTTAGTATRSFAVGVGTPLLFPLVNILPTQWPVPLEEQVVSNFYAGSGNLIATIDGVPVPNLTSYGETSGVTSLGPAAPGSFGETFETPGFPGDPACPSPFPPDLLCPVISAGYYLMVNLPPGEHVIETGGTYDFDLPNDPTYIPGGFHVHFDTLTTDIIDVVVPEPSSALLLLPALFGLSFCCIWGNGRKRLI